MSYTSQRDAFGRRVQYLVEIDMDRCTLVYTQGACTASDAGDGSRCWYSFQTCQLPSAYNKGTKTWRFCLNDVPWTDTDYQVYPLLRRFSSVPQKVDVKRLDTYPEKLKLKFALDFNPPVQDHDKGTGFFNTTTKGEFWRTWVARNRNYPGRTLRLLRGFHGEPYSEFQQVGPDFRLMQVTIKSDECEIEAENPLVDLSKRKLPWEIGDDNTLQTAIDTAATDVVVAYSTDFPDPADYSLNTVFVEIDSELMSVSAVDTATDTLTVARGRWGTTAASHSTGAEVKHVLCIGDDAGTATPDPITVGAALQRMLEWAGIPSTDVATASFTALDDGFWPDADVVATVRKSKESAKHLKGLRQSRGIVLYIDSDGKYAASPVAPDANPTELDESKLVLDSVSFNEDDEERVTRATLYYDPAEDNASDPKDFNKWVVVIDADLENANNYDDQKHYEEVDAWIDASATISAVRNIARRIITRRSGGVRTFDFELELKDGSQLNVGDAVTIISAKRLDANGDPDPRPCIVTAKKETSAARFAFSAVDTNLKPSARGYLRMGPNTMADEYDSASDDDKGYGYWGDSDNRVGSIKEPGYIFW